MENLNLIKNHFVDTDYLRSFIAALLRMRTRASTSYAVSFAEKAYTTANTFTGYMNYLNDLTNYFHFVDFNLKDDNFLWEIDYVLAGLVYSDLILVLTDFVFYLDMKSMILCQFGTYGVCHQL